MTAKNLVLPSLAAILFVFGVGIGASQLSTNEKVKAQVKVLSTAVEDSVDEDTSLPSEVRPENELKSYHVAPDLPRILRITRLDAEARVVRLGVKANNELRAPTNIYDVGWYEGSAKPGDDGASLMYGHVHGPSQPGVFADLKKIRTGDQITIERGDGKLLTYRVVKSQSYDKDSVDMGAVFSSIEPGKPGLNLMTCDGSYDDQGNYAKRLVVFAVQED